MQMTMKDVKIMTDKAYIVANEQQEMAVLGKFEREGLKWKGFSEEPTQWVPTRDSIFNRKFPYVLFGNDVVSWCKISELQDDYEIVFDGRKEEQMSDKYVVSQEFMNELVEWKDTLDSNDVKRKPIVQLDNLEYLPNDTFEWISSGLVMDEENNNRLIAIIRWVNGEDVFEVKSKKWVVRSKNTYPDGTHRYVQIIDGFSDWQFSIVKATKFDTKEEAEGWANAHQEVVEVEE